MDRTLDSNAGSANTMMKVDPSTSALREALQSITENNVGNDGIGRQLGLIERLKAVHPHQIALVAEAQPGKPDTFNFNCFQFALGIVESPEIVGIARRGSHKDAFPGNRFVTWLALRKLSERHPDEVSDGDLVLYCAGTEVRHAGLWASGMVISKWGTAHTWKHALSEVPASFGNDAKLFIRPDPEQTIRWFHEYVTSLAS